jgi:hypothetical protein
MVNFWENDKNISPPLYDLWEKMWGTMGENCGER